MKKIFIVSFLTVSLCLTAQANEFSGLPHVLSSENFKVLEYKITSGSATGTLGYILTPKQKDRSTPSSVVVTGHGVSQKGDDKLVPLPGKRPNDPSSPKLIFSGARGNAVLAEQNHLPLQKSGFPTLTKNYQELTLASIQLESNNVPTENLFGPLRDKKIRNAFIDEYKKIQKRYLGASAADANATREFRQLYYSLASEKIFPGGSDGSILIEKKPATKALIDSISMKNPKSFFKMSPLDAFETYQQMITNEELYNKYKNKNIQFYPAGSHDTRIADYDNTRNELNGFREPKNKFPTDLKNPKEIAKYNDILMLTPDLMGGTGLDRKLSNVVNSVFSLVDNEKTIYSDARIEICRVCEARTRSGPGQGLFAGPLGDNDEEYNIIKRELSNKPKGGYSPARSTISSVADGSGSGTKLFNLQKDIMFYDHTTGVEELFLFDKTQNKFVGVTSGEKLKSWLWRNRLVLGLGSHENGIIAGRALNSYNAPTGSILLGTEVDLIEKDGILHVSISKNSITHEIPITPFTTSKHPYLPEVNHIDIKPSEFDRYALDSNTDLIKKDNSKITKVGDLQKKWKEYLQRQNKRLHANSLKIDSETYKNLMGSLDITFTNSTVQESATAVKGVSLSDAQEHFKSNYYENENVKGKTYDKNLSVTSQITSDGYVENKHSTSFPDKPLTKIPDVFPDLNQKLEDVTYPSTNEHLRSRMTGKVTKTIRGAKIVVSHVAEILGPIGDIVGAGLWINGMFTALNDESVGDFDKAVAILSEIPIVGEILTIIQHDVDISIARNRTKRIHESGHPFDTRKADIADYDEDRRRWVQFGAFFKDKFMHNLARGVIEDIVLKNEHIYQNAVKAHNENLDHLFKKTNFELFKAIQAEIIKETHPDAEVKMHGNLTIHCQELTNTIKNINCLKDSYTERWDELMKFVNKDTFISKMTLTSTKYVNNRKKAVQRSKKNLDILKSKMLEEIRRDSISTFNKVLDSEWFAQAGELLYHNVYTSAFHEFTDNYGSGRKPTAAEIASGSLFIREATRHCRIIRGGSGVIDESRNCTTYPALYKYFSRHADKKLRSSVNLADTYRQKDTFRLIFTEVLKTYLPKVLNGTALSVFNPPEFISIIDNSILNYSFKTTAKDRMLSLGKIIRVVLQSSLNSNKMWNSSILARAGFNNEEATHIMFDRIPFRADLLWRFKTFVDSRTTEYRPTLVSKLKKLLSNKSSVYTDYMAHVKYPFFSIHPVAVSLDTASPELATLYTELTTANKYIKLPALREKFIEKINEIYQRNKHDQNMLHTSLGDLVRVQQYINVISKVSSDKPTGLFFQDELAIRHKIWLKEIPVSTINEAAQTTKNILTGAHASGLKFFSLQFQQQLITTANICKLNTLKSKVGLRSFKNRNDWWDKIIYIPYMLPQILELLDLAGTIVDEVVYQQSTPRCVALNS